MRLKCTSYKEGWIFRAILGFVKSFVYNNSQKLYTSVITVMYGIKYFCKTIKSFSKKKKTFLKEEHCTSYVFILEYTFKHLFFEYFQ